MLISCGGGTDFAGLLRQRSLDDYPRPTLIANGFTFFSISNPIYFHITEPTPPHFELYVRTGGVQDLTSTIQKVENGYSIKLSSCRCRSYTADLADSFCIPPPRFELMVQGIDTVENNFLTNFAMVLVRGNSFEELGGFRFAVIEAEDAAYVPSNRIVWTDLAEGGVALVGHANAISSNTVYSIQFSFPKHPSTGSYQITSSVEFDNDVLLTFSNQLSRLDYPIVSSVNTTISGNMELFVNDFFVLGNFSAFITGPSDLQLTIANGEIALLRNEVCKATQKDLSDYSTYGRE